MTDPIFVPFDVLAKLFIVDPEYAPHPDYWSTDVPMISLVEWPENALTGPTYRSGLLVEREHILSALGDRAEFLPYPEDWLGEPIPVLGLKE